MSKKEKIRKKFFKIRKNKYFEINNRFFKPVINLIKKKYKSKKINISTYYPSNFEVNTLKFLKTFNYKKVNFLLPIIKNKNELFFVKWNIFDLLIVNRFGMLEPEPSKKTLVPDVALIPLLAYDSKNYRLGYGGGYYDKFLNKYLKKNKNILTIGVAFSFQKYKKLPISKYDVQMQYILTEKGLKKTWKFLL